MVLQYNYPTTILYGPGAVAELGRRLAAGAGRPFVLVTDAGVVKAGLAERVGRALLAAGLQIEPFADVHANPVEEDVERGVEAFRAVGAAGLIALGGGSPMDAAKAIAVLATHDGPLSRFDDSRGGDKLITQPLPPVYAIPTTAGTGSEVGRSSVIITRDTGVKTVIFHPSLMPRMAVLDPELTVGLPAFLTAATGFDAFTHGLEAYLAKGFHPMADAVAMGCMELVVEALPRAVARGDDIEARGRMLLAASMGATAFQKGLGVIHSLAHPLSTRYGIHHGLANALLLPTALAWQLEEKADAFTDDLRDRYQRVARLFRGREKARPGDLPEAVTAFRSRVGIEDTLAERGLEREDIPDLAREAYADPCHAQNPIALLESDLAAMYERCL
ncbi:MAG TPA: iron-containing alcohol dehydrogenase [Vicinamibacteria bacterium]|nr:iron-containing alcohol dehydrogenase [Vicinamibacteria bacterium]